jgi:large subunit ribosomal protein L5
MYYFNYHYNTQIKNDLLSQLHYPNLYLLPKIQKIVLNFGIKEVNFKSILPSLTALTLISSQTPILTRSKTSHILFKIRKGAPVGCKVTLRKASMYLFFSKLVTNIFPVIKQFEGIVFKKSIVQPKSFSFFISDILIFNELENHYELFKNITKLDISVVINSSSLNELKIILTALRFPLK